MRYLRPAFLLVVFFASVMVLDAQTVDVTFRYRPPQGTSGPYYVVGEFNNWSNSQLQMSLAADGFYERVVSLPLGGTPNGEIPGAVQYKFYYSSVSSWPHDPLNPRSNPANNNNSILYVKDPTIYHFLPNQVSGIIRTSRPVVSAYIFPAQGTPVDTGSIRLLIDSVEVSGLGSYYDPSQKKLTYRLPWDIVSGTHAMRLWAGSNVDSVTFTAQTGFAQITNLGPFTTRKSEWTIFGSVADTGITAAKLVKNGTDTTDIAVVSGSFEINAPLSEGSNTFRVAVLDSGGTAQVSDPYDIVRFVDHRPTARSYVLSTGSQLQFTASGSSDPDGDLASFMWQDMPGNPEPLTELNGKSDSIVSIGKPQTQGEYCYRLLVSDGAGNIDTTRQFFILGEGGSVEASQYPTIPLWARQGRMYSMFFKAMTPEGTINASRPYLQYLEQLGVNIIWVLPVMENGFPINNSFNPGYNIKNLFRVDPAYGTNDDFRQFVEEAHSRGMRVLLDVTPNHTSAQHPFVLEGRLFGRISPYWNFYMHRIIPHDDNGLGQSLTSDGYNYYHGFSDQLLNYDWADIDARAYMVGVYDWWVREFDLDGYRFDVYWGPRRRANNGAGGGQEMGIPTRTALKHRKADIFLLGEDAGTGVGTEVIYADDGGGVDAGYDWGLYHDGVRTFAFTGTAVDGLHNRLWNNGYVPGPNARFLRFLENHDEERIAYAYGSYEKTRPVSAAVLLSPGMPLLYAGQEIGWGFGISDFNKRRRGVIDWNAPGRPVLLEHYQRLYQARKQFRAFDGQSMTRITSGDPLVYAYIRPYDGEDAVVVTNMSSVPSSLLLSVPMNTLGSSLQDGTSYTISDIYSDSLQTSTASSGSLAIRVNLPAYGVFVGIIADSPRYIDVPVITSVARPGYGGTIPTSFVLYQNYPNPFNSSTTIRFDLPSVGTVSLIIYDALGQEVARIAEGPFLAGMHRVTWDTGHNLSSGTYFARLRWGSHVTTTKLLYLR